MTFQWHQEKSKHRRGFTILEMLISVIMLVVGTIAMINVLSIAMAAAASVEHSSVALTLAQEQMESIKDAASWTDIDTFVSPRTNIGGSYADFDREVTVDGNDPKQVDVIVYWNVKGAVQQISLSTLMSNYNY